MHAHVGEVRGGTPKGWEIVALTVFDASHPREMNAFRATRTGDKKTAEQAHGRGRICVHLHGPLCHPNG
jgi:hypothetical protein